MLDINLNFAEIFSKCFKQRKMHEKHMNFTELRSLRQRVPETTDKIHVLLEELLNFLDVTCGMVVVYQEYIHRPIASVGFRRNDILVYHLLQIPIVSGNTVIGSLTYGKSENPKKVHVPDEFITLSGGVLNDYVNSNKPCNIRVYPFH